MAKVWNVGVVGCGIGRSHILEGYASQPDMFRTAAICDLDEARLATVGDEFGVPVRTRSFDELLANPDIDIVDICTPPSLHVPQSLAALAAGKQVICEKPLAGSLAEADRLIAAEAQSKGRVLPIFQYRFGDGLQKAKRILDLGLAGKPYVATVETAWSRKPAYYTVPWRGRWDTELGGVLVGHSIHLHDLMCYFMGPIASVFGRVATRVNAIEVEDCAAASLLMESGALVTLSATLGSQKEISRLRFCFENVTFESSLAPYSPGDAPWEIVPASPEMAAKIDEALAGWQFVPSRFHGLMQAYHEALETGGPLPVTLTDARRSLELISALYHSNETGQPVALPLGADHPKYHGWRPGPAAAAA